MTTPHTPGIDLDKLEAILKDALMWVAGATCEQRIKSALSLIRSARQAAPEAPTPTKVVCAPNCFYGDCPPCVEAGIAPATQQAGAAVGHVVDNDKGESIINVSLPVGTEVFTAAITASASDSPLSSAEFLSKRLARVARLVGVTMPSHMTHEDIAAVAGTILGNIARALEGGRAPAASRDAVAIQIAPAFLEAAATCAEYPETVAPELRGKVAAKLRQISQYLAQQGAAQASHAAADTERDAKRYQVLRSHVAPRDVTISMYIPLTDIPPDQTIEERIDMLCDQAIAANAAEQKGPQA